MPESTILQHYLENGIIELPNYTPNMTESWYISANCDQVEIWDKYLFVESPFDTVEIKDDNRTMTFTGISYIFETISANFSIFFRTNASVERKGFKLKWKCV